MAENNETYLYIYRMSVDSGFAPCVKNGRLSLACCKGGQIRSGKPCHTGLRYWIGSKRHADWSTDDVYVAGTYKNRLVYIAKVTGVVTMEDYFGKSSNGRTDDIYSLSGGKLERNDHLRAQGVHIDDAQITRDLAGSFVLLSNEYVYLGKDAVSIDIVNRYNAQRQETKQYSGDIANEIIKACFSEARLSHDDGIPHRPTTPVNAKCGGK